MRRSVANGARAALHSSSEVTTLRASPNRTNGLCQMTLDPCLPRTPVRHVSAELAKIGGDGSAGGIPNVTDRVVCEAVRQVLEPVFEPMFHPSSHGFRPGRSCHTAIEEAKQHLEDGYGWGVDVDLEKFFDRVCH